MNGNSCTDGDPPSCPKLVHTSTALTGIVKIGNESWAVRKEIDGRCHCFPSPPCEDEAAAAALHDIATLWSLLRKNGALLSVKYISPSTASNAPSRAMLPSHMHAAPLHSQVV